MAKRGTHYGFTTARVNANVESRAIIADALALDFESWLNDDRYDQPLPADCINAEGICCSCCGGCYCTPAQKFAHAFNQKMGKKVLDNARRLR